ncbi:MAG: iron dependent repressor, metal binding and dimerization domain protein [Candidatus Latescibacterota bacterium]|nr:iron dependent repressor, metal binding and dimerization domain protein [Candidatus Latescibacterota bacterium]
MVDPLLALLGAALIALVGGGLFWPGRGYFWRWHRLRWLSERVFVEDTLKHLYHCEYRRQQPTVDSLSGALGITGNRAAELLVGLEKMRLSETMGGGLRLTAEGRDYALRIVRVHRLWEQYLAEETGLAEADWHSEAEYREHLLSPDEADMLAEQMGHPTYDPHGDPIPTASGGLPPRNGRPCTDLAAGTLARIAHIEDEPEDIYAQLAGQGLHPGMLLEVMEIAPERVLLLAEGVERILSPIAAANIFVAPVELEGKMEGPHKLLSDLKLRERGWVLRLSPTCRGLERRRLMDLGVLPGTVIEAEMKSPSGDPTAYIIRGALIALRREQAQQIYIAKTTEEA